MNESIAFPQDHLIAASSPGGIARHYRVQLFDTHSGEWRMHCAFRFGEQAAQCASELESEGASVRVVKYGICPVAA